jgi:heme a synthase
MQEKRFLWLLNAALALALTVTVLGAYVRLSDAGLGCPDWPGCYGHLVLPQDEAGLAHAATAFPTRPLTSHKAWKEMAHRYAAGLLVLAVMILSITAIAKRARLSPVIPAGLLALILFQALLGMWTVTLQLKPIIVMGHLLGGFTTLALLWWWRMTVGRTTQVAANSPADMTRVSAGPRGLAFAGLVVLVAQIALGGWTSANYAALACPDFPTCQGVWWPETDFGEAFVLWRGLGIDYEFGVLDNPARTAIHLAHRLGAVLTTLLLALLAMRLIRVGVNTASGRSLMLAGAGLLTLLGAQIAFGVSNVIFHLPMGTAVAHNGVAALLLLATLTAVFLLKPQAVTRRYEPWTCSCLRSKR